MTQEEFRDEFRELMCKAMDSNIDPSWVMGEAAFQVFAMFMARAEVNAEQAKRRSN